MSHIHHINESNPGLPAAKSGTAKQKGTTAFEDALSKAIDKDPASAAGSGETMALSEIPSHAFKVREVSDAVSGRTDELLNLLDAYSAKLGNPETTMKQIAPVLNKLNQDAGKLLEQSRLLDQSDETLRKIATQTAVTAKSEYVKFQRGDYLS